MSAIPAHVAAMLHRATIVRVATASPDGQPTAAPFWFWFDGMRIVLDTLENATVANVRATRRAAVLVDEGLLFDELRTATIAADAVAYRPDQAPPAVLACVDALRAAHEEETASPIFDAYASRETRAQAYLELLPRSARFWSADGAS